MVTVVERCGDMKTVPSTISTLYPSGTGIRSSASNIASRVRSLSLSAISILSVGKPAPDLFLHAARSLGVEPGRCAVVEDSAYGVRAARAAGMRAFGHCGGLTPAARPAGPGTVVFGDMRELPPAARDGRGLNGATVTVIGAPREPVVPPGSARSPHGCGGLAGRASRPGRARAAQAVRRDGSTTETRLPSRARTPMAARPRAPRWTTVSQVSGRP